MRFNIVRCSLVTGVRDEASGIRSGGRLGGQASGIIRGLSG